MAIHVIRVPDIGEGVAEVELVAWHVKPGERIIEDQVLADVMTDKATVEVPSPVHGVVESLGGEPGQVLAVGAELIRIETDAAVKPASGSAASSPAAAAAPARGPARGPAKALAQASAQAPAATAAAAAKKATPASSMAAAQVRAAPPLPSAAVTTTLAAVATTDGAPARATPARVLASPSVRARAWELGIDLAQVRAGSPSGRVMHADLDAHVALRGGARQAQPPAAAPRTAPAVPRAEVEDTVEAIRIIGLRRKIAQKMQESTRRIPHFSYHEEVDVTELEALREHLNQRGGAGGAEGAPRLSPLAFVIVAICRAVPEFPQVNGTLDDEAGVLHRHSAVHVGVAAQTDAGLLVPVLRDAQSLGLAAIAAETARLAALARSGKATRGELAGSTITVTSLGKLGGIATTPVINHPEVAIIGVNKIVERPVMRRGAVVGRLMMNLSGSFDHRVVDGAVAAGFVQRVRELLEHPATLFLGER
ncbi:MAG: 2-oxo acid dehydrogenase subunit E2 [Rubrivivax sp.]|nr:2-oxo acid dehydrogenase subunit E2 [Rubrivivax sp.]